MVNTNLLLKLGLLIAGLFIGYFVNDNIWSAKWAKAEQQASQNQLNAVNEVVKSYNKHVAELHEINENAGNEIAKINANNSELDAINKRLQDDLAYYMSRPSSCDTNTTVVTGVKTETFNRKLYSDMFRVVSDRASEYAKVADENRVRGLNCQAEYESLRKYINELD